MLSKFIYEDKTLERAFDKFYKEHNLTKNEILYNEIIEKKGLLKTNKVSLEIILKEDVKNLIIDVLNNISKGLNVNINYEISIDEDIININCFSDNSAALIGKNGKMLNAIQLLLKKIIEINTNFYIRINLDIENYKKRKLDIFEKEIKKLINEVLSTKVDIKLDAMNSFQRRIVHNLVSTYDKLKSESEGEEPNRYVIIKYVER